MLIKYDTDGMAWNMELTPKVEKKPSILFAKKFMHLLIFIWPKGKIKV